MIRYSAHKIHYIDTWKPLFLEKNAGKSLDGPKLPTVTPSVSRYSSVRPTSRMDLIPADTTATGVRPSSVTSAETSKAKQEGSEGGIVEAYNERTKLATPVNTAKSACRKNLDTS